MSLARLGGVDGTPINRRRCVYDTLRVPRADKDLVHEPRLGRPADKQVIRVCGFCFIMIGSPPTGGHAGPWGRAPHGAEGLERAQALRRRTAGCCPWPPASSHVSGGSCPAPTCGAAAGRAVRGCGRPAVAALSFFPGVRPRVIAGGAPRRAAPGTAEALALCPPLAPCGLAATFCTQTPGVALQGQLAGGAGLSA